ncbi:MAG: hypothetical protein U9M95_01045, partial [Candidatus Altiarchaeota archaeon]|nr:hypothetical protein [Candidatus Altiarchaeota archaeon]
MIGEVRGYRVFCLLMLLIISSIGLGSGSDCKCRVDLFPGYDDFCSICGPCNQNEGPCKSDDECKGNLVCDQRHGYDFCVTPEVASAYPGWRCPFSEGHHSYCAVCKGIPESTSGALCFDGEGWCHSYLHCMGGMEGHVKCDSSTGHVCKRTKGPGITCELDGSGVGDYIVSVTHNLVDNDEIEITVRIRNPTSEEINHIRAYVLRGSDNKEMEYEPNLWGESIQPGEEITITLTSSGDPGWDVHSLGGSYRIRINERDEGIDLSELKYISTAPTGVYPEECVCDCNGLVLNLISQEGFCELTCARACGTHTNCRSDCENCCNDWCSGKGDECVKACLERCQMTSGVDELVEAIKSAVIIIAAIIFALCSIQYLIAGNPESRDWAKKCITYVIIGLIILGLALLIVELFGGMVEPGGKCVRTISCDDLCKGEGYSNNGGATCYTKEDCRIKCSGDCVPRESCDEECGGIGYSNDEGRTCYKDEDCNIVCPEIP